MLTYTSFKADVAVKMLRGICGFIFLDVAQFQSPCFFLLFFVILIIVFINFFTLKTLKSEYETKTLQNLKLYPNKFRCTQFILQPQKITLKHSQCYQQEKMKKKMQQRSILWVDWVNHPLNNLKWKPQVESLILILLYWPFYRYGGHIELIWFN